jgi:hypothetical protein
LQLFYSYFKEVYGTVFLFAHFPVCLKRVDACKNNSCIAGLSDGMLIFIPNECFAFLETTVGLG